MVNEIVSRAAVRSWVPSMSGRKQNRLPFFFIYLGDIEHFSAVNIANLKQLYTSIGMSYIEMFGNIYFPNTAFIVSFLVTLFLFRKRNS